MEPYQQFRLGSTIELLAVRRDLKRDYYYSRLSDIQHYFPSAWGFKVDGINILFLEDENEECILPKRIAHYPNSIIDIVTTNQEEQQLPSPASLVDEIQDQDASSYENKDHDGILIKEVDQSEPAPSAQPNTTVTTRPRRATFGSDTPLPQLPATLVTKPSPIDTDVNQKQQSAIVNDINEPLSQPCTASTETHSQEMAQQLESIQISSEQSSHSDVDKEVDHAIDEKDQEEQQQTMIQLVLEQKTLDAKFAPNDELYEYPIPRLFVLLPSPFTCKIPSGVTLPKLRLYFLCECGGQCSKNSPIQDIGDPSNQRPTTVKATTEPPGSRPKTMVHLVRHDGYEISRTAEFIETYGIYVLGMLAVLKHSLALSTLTHPELGVFHERSDVSSKTLDTMVKNTLANINLTIDSLEKTLGIDNTVDTMAKKADSDTVEKSETFRHLRTLDGAEHRRLDTFLRSHNQDGFLGDLYRITMESGLSKWVCFEHYRSIYAPSTMDSFIVAIEANGGAYSPYLSKAVINLTSSAAAKDFFAKLASPALALDELDIALDWKFGSSDLAALASAVAQSNLRILRLDMRDDKGKKSAFEGMSLGKGRYQPLLQMVSSKKLRGLFFSNVHHLGSRLSGLPQNQPTSTLQRFHLLNVIESADQVRLANILTSCPHLVDLRLGSFSSERRMHPTLYLAVTSLKMLKNLHIYNMDTGPQAPSFSSVTNKSEDMSLSRISLKGLVSTGHKMNKGFESLIKTSAGILEVLVLDFAEKQHDIVDLSPFQHKAHTSSSQRQSLGAISHSPRPFSRLTHLHLGSRMTASSIELLASVIWNLSLVHFGTDEHSKQLLKYVNFSSLKSLSLTDISEYDLHPLFDAFLDEKRPCQLERMDIKLIGHVHTLSDLLHAVPLKRLELIEFDRIELSKILPALNLTRLDVLTIHPPKAYGKESFTWENEALLACRLKEMSGAFLVQYKSILTPIDAKSNARTLEGTSYSLPIHRIVNVQQSEADTQRWHSILSTVF
ncbi:hypothetical protein FBU30_000485 [Linnemannia zychae]|nr:hypothetical protein FBU30_000485 [Linnemannia zychae]